MTRKTKTPQLPPEEVQKWVDLLIAFQQKRPGTDTFRYIEEQLAKGIIIAQTEILTRDLTYEESFRITAPQTYTGIVAHGCEKGRGATSLQLYIPDLRPNTTIYTHQYRLIVLHGSLRNVWRYRGITLGRHTLYGSIAHAIKSGKAFRGR